MLKWQGRSAVLNGCLVMLVVLQILAGFGGTVTQAGPSPLLVDIVDVGQGNAALIQTPSGSTVLIDGGPADQGKDLVDSLKACGINQIDAVILTHAHADHVGGLLAVLRGLRVVRVYDPGFPHPTSTYTEFLSLIHDKHIPYFLARSGTVVSFDAGPVRIDILHPTELHDDVNDSSAVAQVSYGDTRFLFPADIEAAAESMVVLRYGNRLASSVVVIPHHGSNTSSSPPFIAAVTPDFAVVSAAADNPYGHPDPDVVHRWKAAGAQVLSTAGGGSLRFASDGYSVTRPNAVEKLINLNIAEAPALESLPGVGPVIAQRIVDYREAHGNFRAVDDLIHVKGIGPKRLADIRPLVTVHAPQREAVSACRIH